MKINEIDFSHKIYIFVYGMLTDPKYMFGADLVGVAELKNFEYKMYQFANVEPATGESVFGCLWAIDKEILSQLDKMEGYPTLYDRRTYPVYVNGEKYPAEVYVMTPNTLRSVQGTFPSKEYLKTVARGYINAGIPTEQIQAALYNAKLNEEFETGGSLGLPFPGTYEQERMSTTTPSRTHKIVAMTNESLDSSYPYTRSSTGKRYNFKTDAGIDYEVIFSGDRLVEISFFAERKTGRGSTKLTGTGDSRRVLGTVINIILEYADIYSPIAFHFSAENDEPSRVKLYNALTDRVEQAMPEYEKLPPVDLGSGTGFILRHKDASDTDITLAFESRTSQNSVTLDELYNGVYPDENELIWNFVGQMDFDIPFTLNIMRPDRLNNLLCDMYNVSNVKRSIYNKLPNDQKEIVDAYQRDPNLSSQVIVLADELLVDGNHRALAAVLSNSLINYIDVAEEVEEGLTEIAHADAIPPLNWKPEMKEKCNVIGQADGYDIYAMGFGEKRLFAFLGNDGELLAYIVVGKPSNEYPDYLPLVRIENLSKVSGLATTLALGIRTLGAKFMISNKEPLTSSGLNWVFSLIKSGNKAFTVTDQVGNLLDKEKLKSEWKSAHVDRESGPTAILIEFHKKDIKKLIENNKHYSEKSILLPYPVHLGNIELL